MNDSGGAHCCSSEWAASKRTTTYCSILWSQLSGDVEECNLFDSCQCHQQPRTRTSLFRLCSTSDQHVDFTRKEREPVSTLHSSHSTQRITDDIPSLYLDRMQRFTSISIHTADLSHHSEITLQDVPKLKHSLRLLVDSEEKGLRRMDNRTWEPVQRLYAHISLIGAPTKIRVHVEVHLRHPRCALRFK